MGGVSEVNPYVVALLYAGDRADAGPKIRRWLLEDKYVLLDRYVNSNIAFQCAKLDDIKDREELSGWIKDTEFVKFGIPSPDISIFLDVPFEFTEKKLSGNRQGTDRDYLNGGRDIHEESLDLQRRVREVYLWSAESDPDLCVVDCSAEEDVMASPDVIFSRVERELQARSIL